MYNKKINDLINRNSFTFTDTDEKIADYVLNNPKQLLNMTTISNFSKQSGFSSGSIVRFCKKLGFEGYSDFKFFIVNNYMEIEVEHREDYLTTLVDIYIDEINVISNNINQEAIADLAKAVIRSNNILIAGKNNSKIAAHQLQNRLIQTGISAFAIEDDFNLYHFADLLAPKDILIIFSVNGYSFNSHLDIIEDYQSNDIDVFLITCQENSPLFQAVTKQLLIPMSNVNKKSLAIEEQFLFIFFIEILIHKIILEKNKK